jgi:hypothetical protein
MSPKGTELRTKRTGANAERITNNLTSRFPDGLKWASEQ